MKKQLLALAVAGAIAAPAMAQNVTITGTLDTGILHKEDAGTKTTTTAGDDQYGSSGLSIKGSEDLGAGMKAYFELKTALRMGDGSTDELGANGQGSTKDAGVLFDEASYVGISTSMGSFAFGRIGTATDDIKSAANMGANLFTNTDAVANETAAPIANTVRIDTKVGGLGLTLTNSRGGDSVEYSKDVTSVGAAYALGSVKLNFAYAETSEEVKESVLNASTSVGPVALVAQYLTNKKTTGTAKVAKLGAKYSIGATDVLLSVQSASIPASRESASLKDEQAAGVMFVQNLSKRTSVYAGYNNRGGDMDITYYTAGLQHKF
jgi:predicted porin